MVYILIGMFFGFYVVGMYTLVVRPSDYWTVIIVVFSFVICIGLGLYTIWRESRPWNSR